MSRLAAGLAACFAISITLAGAAEPSLQTAPPVVVKTEPVAGTADIDPTTSELRVTFSKPMQDGNWSWTTWGENDFPEMAGQPRYLADGRTCVLPVKLQPGKFYATWLNSEKFKNFKDAEGRPAVPYLLTFTTARQAAQGGANAHQGERKFVRVVLDGERMTFEGEPASWDTLDAMLSAVPDRGRTVLDEPDQLAATLEESNRRFLEKLSVATLPSAAGSARVPRALRELHRSGDAPIK